MDKVEEAKNKLLNLEELSDEEMNLLQENFTQEQLSEMINSAFMQSNPEDVLKTIDSNLFEIRNYISSMIASNNKIREANENFKDLLRSVEIFANNFHECVLDTIEGTTDSKWTFRVD